MEETRERVMAFNHLTRNSSPVNIPDQMKMAPPLELALEIRRNPNPYPEECLRPFTPRAEEIMAR